MTYIVPALVMMLSHMCTTAQTKSQHRSDAEIVQVWLDFRGSLIERMEHPELQEEYLACKDMYGMAKARHQAVSDRFLRAMDWSYET